MRVPSVRVGLDLATDLECCTNCAMVDESHLSAPVLYLSGAGSRTAGEVAELDRDETRHVRALRLDDGAPVRVTDARGALWAARLDRAGRSVRLLEALPPPPPLDVELWTGVGNKQATLWMVEKAAEFGLRRLGPVDAARSASVADAGRSDAFWEKAARRAVAAVKQSGSARAPEIVPPAPLAERLAAVDASRPKIVLDPGGPPLVEVLGDAGRDAPGTPIVLVGPEGGLTGEELAAATAAGFRPASLGPTVLRFETAAVAALAVAAQLALRSSTPGADA